MAKVQEISMTQIWETLKELSESSKNIDTKLSESTKRWTQKFPKIVTI